MTSASPSGVATGRVRFDRVHPGRSRRFLQPGRPAFWLYVVLVGAAASLLVWGFVVAGRGLPPVLLVGAVWLMWTWLGYWLISRADLLEVVPTGVRVAALVWGIVCLTYSGPLDGFIERTFPVQGPFRDAIYAPPPEDGMKLLGVILIAGVVPHILRRRMGAVVVGLLVGLGFSFTENWFMSNAVIAGGDVSGLPGLMLLRATVGAWSHSVFAAVAAVGVWYVLARPQRSLLYRLLVALAWFIAGMLLHAAHDAATNLTVAAADQVVEVAVLVALIWWARRAEHHWLTRSTADDLPPVTAEDARVLASRRARRAARTAASTQAQPRGRKAASQAAGAVNRRHHTQLAYLNALDTDTDEHTLNQMRRQLANKD